MADGWGRVGIDQVDADDIETQGLVFELVATLNLNGEAGELTLLLRADAKFGFDLVWLIAGLDFDNHNRLTVGSLGEEIDFAEAILEVLGDDFVAVVFEEVCGGKFALLAWG